jgi:glycosyltransferase involved in cell wall biosynthesis
MSNTLLRLHLPAIPHTITRDEYSHCAFTGKVLRFAKMMQSRGFEVFHYGVETSTTDASLSIDLLSKEEWLTLRVDSYKMLHPDLSEETILAKLADPRSFVGDLGNYTTPLYKEFNRRLRIELKTHYRSRATDIVCLPFGLAHEDAIRDMNYVTIESGIGYPDSYSNFRIFESYCILHQAMEKFKKGCQHYWFVVPNYYNLLEWPFEARPTSNKVTVGYFGRIGDLKGCHIVKEIAKCFPHVDFIICGQGDASAYVKDMPNLTYKLPIHGEERGQYLGSLTALLAPSMYAEPFCGVNVEAQICGTPIITNDFGAFVETVEQGKTGLRCHTLAEFCYGLQLAIDGKFDRAYIRERAVTLYDMYNVARQYEHVFKTVLEVSNGNNGWYSKECHLEAIVGE